MAHVRAFAYRHPGRMEATLLIKNARVPQPVMFLSGPDYGYSTSPWHGEKDLFRTDEGSFIRLVFRYFGPADWQHDVTFRFDDADGVWKIVTLGYPAITMVEMMPCLGAAADQAALGDAPAGTGAVASSSSSTTAVHSLNPRPPPPTRRRSAATEAHTPPTPPPPRPTEPRPE